eukprot:1383927-Amorphochlora_amoeboformis.AAC.1
MKVGMVDNEVDDDSIGHPHTLVTVPYATAFALAEIIILWIILFTVSFQLAGVYPFLFLPIAPLIWYMYKNRELVHRTFPEAAFAVGFLPGMFIIWFVETILFSIVRIIFKTSGAHTDPDNEDEERDDGYVVYWLFVSFIVFSLSTETGKYLVLRYARIVWPNALETKGSIILTVAGAMGFAISNNVMLLLINATWNKWDFATTLAWGVYLSLVMDTVHCLTAYYIAIMVARRDIFSHDIKIYHILGVPIFARGVLVFASSPVPAFMKVALNPIGAVMWVVIILVDLVIVAGLILLIMRAQGQLPRNHVAEGGYLQILGTGDDVGPESETGLDLKLSQEKNGEEEEI